MNITDILKLTENKLASLRTQRADAFQVGSMEVVVGLDEQITETEITIDQLKSL